MYPCFAFEFHLVLMTIDPDLGTPDIRRYFLGHDCGTVINPKIVRGMTMGGIAHGIGAALYEEFAYDAQGQLVAQSLMDYLLPSAHEVPPVEIIHHVTPSPHTVFGQKGSGESGYLGAPAAIASAVNDALRPLGIVVNSDQTTHGVGRAARRVAYNDPHRPRRIRLRPSDPRHGRQRSGARGQVQKISAGKFHVKPPSHLISFDHLVGAGEQRWWHFEAERLRGLEVDRQLVLVHGVPAQRRRRRGYAHSATIAEEAQQEYEDVDEVEIERKRAHYRFAADDRAVLHRVVHFLDTLRVPGGQARESAPRPRRSRSQAHCS
jgi:CO/xanthine dehydrogenase Mo-binding subunit